MSLIKSATHFANTHWIYKICDTSWTRSKVWVRFHHGMKNLIDRVCGQIVRTLLALTKCLRQRLKHNMLNRCCQHDMDCNKLCKDSIWENTCKQAIDILCARNWNTSLAHNARRSFLQNLQTSHRRSLWHNMTQSSTKSLVNFIGAHRTESMCHKG